MAPPLRESRVQVRIPAGACRSDASRGPQARGPEGRREVPPPEEVPEHHKMIRDRLSQQSERNTGLLHPSYFRTDTILRTTRLFWLLAVSSLENSFRSSVRNLPVEREGVGKVGLSPFN